MPRIRAAWLIILVVVLLILAVKPLRQQAILPITGREGLFEHPDALAKRAAAFVKQRYPDDPEMLLGAGLLFIDRESAVDILKQAAEKGDQPAAWAAYYAALRPEGPGYMRLGNQGVDPGRPEIVAGAEATMRESELPDRLVPKEAQPLLSALQSWAAADPENGLPLALQTDVLYGLHQDQQAFAAWQSAATRPKVRGYSHEGALVISKLLTRMGFAKPETYLIAQTSADIESYPSLREGARIALYEGKLAQMQGRNGAAIRWWDSTSTIGRRMQQDSDTTIGYMIGRAIEGIGASPAWQRYQDKSTGTTGGPLSEGRYWHGRDHAFYVSQVGEEQDKEVRDSLVRNKVRVQMLREDTEGMMDRFMTGPYMRSVKLVMFGAGAALFGVLCLLLFLAVGTWRRKQADEATHLRPVCQFILTLAPFAPLAIAAVASDPPDLYTTCLTEILMIVGLALAPLALVFLPLLAAASTRAPGAKLATAWRGNLRRVLPDTAAIAMLCFLALNLAALKPRAEWVRQWSDPKMTEMAQVRQRLGEKWENPPIPKDAWRAEYPKLKEQPL